MSVRYCLTLLLLAPLCRADDAPAAEPAVEAAPAENMAEHRLREISEHQMELFSDAAAKGKALDTADFQGQAEQLTREYESLLRDNPKFANGYASYGYMLWKVGLHKQAVAILLKANELDPNIPLVKNELGNYLAEDGKPLQAVNYFLAAIKLQPKEPLYHYQLGTLLYEARDDFLKSGEWTRDSVDHAIHEAFKNAAELAPDRIEFTYRYAESFYDMSDPNWPEALKVWQRLESQAKGDLERQTMRLHQANVLITMGKPGEARAVLATVTEQDLSAQKQKLEARMGGPAAK
jgi:tetratricopeptide (TPR) repeat protein